MDLRNATGAEVRRLARGGELTGPTPGLALGYVQTNLVVVPRELAFDFLLFCQRNPRPCPLLDVTEPGSAEPRAVAPGADLRTDPPGGPRGPGHPRPGPAGLRRPGGDPAGGDPRLLGLRGDPADGGDGGAAAAAADAQPRAHVRDRPARRRTRGRLTGPLLPLSP